MGSQVQTVRAPYHLSSGPDRVTHSTSPQSKYASGDVDIVDIRDGGLSLCLAEDIRSGLKEDNESLKLPSLLLWNEAGLQYFEQVTFTPEYYLTNTEISLLETHALSLARDIHPNSILLELGSGNLRKTGILIEALEKMGKHVDYYALDLDYSELSRTLRQIRPSRFMHVRCHGLWGTYDDGRAWIAQKSRARRPKCILSLGSTIGSMTRPEASSFWKEWATTLRQTEGCDADAHVILGLDGCTDSQRVENAYNDAWGANKRFILNALDHANSHLGYRAFQTSDWTVVGSWDADNARHQQYLMPRRTVSFEGKVFSPGQKVLVVDSHKYNEDGLRQLLDGSTWREANRYKNGHYGLHVLSL